MKKGICPLISNLFSGEGEKMIFSDIDLENLIGILSLGHIEVENILEKLCQSEEFGTLGSFCKNELYGNHILELYELCDCNLERFVYHACVELPQQRTGKLTFIFPPYSLIMGLHSGSLNLDRHTKARQYGQPGSFWALQDPPAEKDYEFPIYTFFVNLSISR